MFISKERNKGEKHKENARFVFLSRFYIIIHLPRERAACHSRPERNYSYPFIIHSFLHGLPLETSSFQKRQAVNCISKRLESFHYIDHLEIQFDVCTISGSPKERSCATKDSPTQPNVCRKYIIRRALSKSTHGIV